MSNGIAGSHLESAESGRNDSDDVAARDDALTTRKRVVHLTNCIEARAGLFGGTPSWSGVSAYGALLAKMVKLMSATT